MINKNIIYFGIVGVVAYFFKDTARSVMIDTNDALNNPNVIAFLAMIRQFESAGRYDIVYGSHQFSDYSKHPNLRVPFYNPRSSNTSLSISTLKTLAFPAKSGDNDFSTAAGAYQINTPTYKSLMLLPNMPRDFSPPSQDILAVALLKARGALVHITEGRFNDAIKVASKTWASLPYSTDLQNPKTIAAATTAYIGAGGSMVA
jgi:muramidase (phage lysozyme)